jgi:hypothetical protein
LETLGETCFEGLESLKTMSLNYNQVKDVHKRAFRDLVNMEKIEMVYNQIEYLDDEIFANNVNLRLVLLYNNKLKVISSQLFSKNIKVESLQLQNNAISQIEKGFYTNMKVLTKIDVSSNLCISENIQISRYVQWSSYQFKFKDCFNNYVMMKTTNDGIRDLNIKVDDLLVKVDTAVKRVNNDMVVLEGKLKNDTNLEEFKTNLLNFFEKDQEKFKSNFKDDLNNITSEVRTDLMTELERKVESVLSQNQQTIQEKLVSQDFGGFRDEFSGKFAFIYCMLFIIVVFGCATTFVIFQKLKIFPILGYHSDNRNLIDPEM